MTWKSWVGTLAVMAPSLLILFSYLRRAIRRQR